MDTDLEKRIDAANDEFLSDKPIETQNPDVPVDIHRQQVNAARDYNRKPRLNGSTQKVLVDVKAVLSRLAPYYQKARDDSERAQKIGDIEGSRILKEQYMRDVFTPAIEALVRENSPEEIINATKALNEIDKMVLTDGGRPDGYTSAFVSKLYQTDMGNVLPTSDADVSQTIMKLIRLVSNDQIRSAVGLANKIKLQIDAGEHTASEHDYNIIQKIALRGQ